MLNIFHTVRHANLIYVCVCARMYVLIKRRIATSDACGPLKPFRFGPSIGFLLRTVVTLS